MSAQALNLFLTDLSDLSELLRGIGEEAIREFSADLCTVHAINPVTEEFLSGRVNVGDIDEQEDLVNAQPRPHGLTRRIQDERILVVSELASNAGLDSDFAAAQGILSFVGLSVISESLNRPLAVIYVNYRRKNGAKEIGEREFLEFTEVVAVALQQAWYFRRYQEVERIGEELNQNLSSVSEMFETLVANLTEILNIDEFFMLAEFLPQTNSLNLHMIEDGEIRHLKGESLEGGCEYVIREQKPLIIQHYGDEHLENGDSVDFAQIVNSNEDKPASIIFLPLTLRKIPLGVLSIQSMQPNAFSNDDFQILELLGNQIVLALSNIRLFKAISQLNRVGQELTQQLDSKQVPDQIVKSVQEVTQADLVILYPFEKASDRFQLPPWESGNLRSPDFPKLSTIAKTDYPFLAIRLLKSVFAKDSNYLYEKLGGAPGYYRGNFMRREGILSTAAVPLFTNNEPMGVMFVNFRNPQRFDAPQKLLIEGLANYAAIAIRNSRELANMEERRRREINLLREIGLEISTTLSLPDILGIIIDKLIAHIKTDEAAILLYDPQSEELRVAEAVGKNADVSKSKTYPLKDDHGITLWVYKNKTPALVHDVREKSFWKEKYAEISDQTRSELDVPLVDGDECIGVISLERETPEAYTEDDQAFVEALAGAAVLAIKNALRYEEERRTREELEGIQPIVGNIVSHIDYESAWDVILEQALQITGSSAGLIMILDQHKNLMRTVAAKGLLPDKKRENLPLGKGITGYVMEHNQLLNVDVCVPPWDKLFKRWIPDVCWELAVPMRDNGVPIGVINIESVDRFSPSDERLIALLADFAVIAWQNAERFREVKEAQTVMTSLHKLDQAIIGQDDNYDDALNLILEMLTQVVEATEQCYLFVTRPNTTSGRLFYATNKTGLPRTEQLDNIRCDSVIEEPSFQVGVESRNCYRLVGDELTNKQGKFGSDTRSEIVVPLKTESGELYGMLIIQSAESYDYDEDIYEFLQLFANQAIVAIQNARRVRAKILAQQNAAQLEETASVGHSAIELAHRLGNSLGRIPVQDKWIRENLEKDPVAVESITPLLDSIVSEVKMVLQMAARLQEVFPHKDDDLKAEELFASSLFDEIASEFVDRTPENVRISVNVEPDVAAAYASHSAVVDILRHLVENATKALANGGEISLTARNEDQFIEFSVEDNGPGIPEKIKNNIFDLFHSYWEGREKKGFGFGLWSARRNAIENGGKLEVKSVEGKGTIFKLLLPRREDKAA